MLSGKVGQVVFQDTNIVTVHPTHQPLKRFEIDFQVYSVKFIVLL